MAQPPLRITGFLCVAVTCLLLGLIVRNALQDDPLSLPQVATEGEGTSPQPAAPSTPPTKVDRPQPVTPDYPTTEDDGGKIVTPPSDGTRRDGSETLRVVPEGFAIHAPSQAKRKVLREGPTFTLSLNLDNQPDFVTVSSRTIYPWSKSHDMLLQYEPYSTAERVTTDGGVDFDSGGNQWSTPDDKTIVIVRGERLYVIRAAGFGPDFPEQVAVVNGFTFLDLPTHAERLMTRHKLTKEQLQAPPPPALKQGLDGMVEQLRSVRGLPRFVVGAIDYHESGEATYGDSLLLKEFFQMVADFVAESMRKH